MEGGIRAEVEVRAGAVGGEVVAECANDAPGLDTIVSVGASVGERVGSLVGAAVGSLVGVAVGAAVGIALGAADDGLRTCRAQHNGRHIYNTSHTYNGIRGGICGRNSYRITRFRY